ncbi:outer membrane beta-barrel protein [Massilia sp. CF038]|uniref:outer membrane beta-barrel protein n=1 Tax=Massilia sp. CF038 TaxID=1881045 RepID=UPI0009220454|nr:outer membrane beta-barrel protein [Massilia sp. CF038]SHH39022.1 OmpA-OmpF porin, OOP family [Massilia sp. CF038]
MFNKIAIAATFALLSSSALAAEPHMYAGVDLGSTIIDKDLFVNADGTPALKSDISRMGAGAFLGYQFNPFIAIEGSARLLADTEVNGVDVKADQIALSAVGTIPLGESGFSVLGRLGYNRVSLRGNNKKFTENKPVIGIGAAYAFTPAVQGRLEYQRLYKEVSNISAGVAVSF